MATLKTYDPQIIESCKKIAAEFYDAFGNKPVELRDIVPHWAAWTDEDKILQLMKRTPRNQVDEVKRQYWNMYGWDLVDEIREELVPADYFSIEQYFIPAPPPGWFARIRKYFRTRKEKRIRLQRIQWATNFLRDHENFPLDYILPELKQILHISADQEAKEFCFLLILPEIHPDKNPLQELEKIDTKPLTENGKK